METMQKLQQMIDAAFPSKGAERVPQQPSGAFAQRQRSFAETATRVESLRQARLTGGEQARSFLLEVVRHRGAWRILRRNRHSSPFSDQAAAVAAAIKLAKAKREAGFAVEVRLNRTDGDVIVQPLDDETPPAK
jgi:predicted DNA-binding WGR domain protein